MRNTPLDIKDVDQWTVYKDGEIYKQLPKSLFTSEELTKTYTERYPDASIVVK